MAATASGTEQLHYHLNETSGSTVYDYSGQNNDGSTFNGVTQAVTGVSRSSGDWGSGLAYHWDGSNDGVSIPDLEIASSGDDQVSFSVWAKMDSDVATGKKMSLISNHNDFLEVNFEDADSDGTWALIIRTSGGNTGEQYDQLQPGELYHIAATWDESTDQTRFYVNGTNVANATNTDSSGDISGYHLGSDKGSPESGNVDVFDGMLDEPHVYDTILNGTQVSNLFQYNQLTVASGPTESSPTVSLDHPNEEENVTNSVVFNYTPTCYGSNCSKAEFYLTNNTTSLYSFTNHQIDSVNNMDGIDILDMDDDGDIDVITGSEGTGEVAWYEQGSDTDTWTKHTITTGHNAIQGVDVADVNGDGKKEVLILDKDAGDILLATQDTSDPTGSWSNTTLDANAPNAQQSVEADIDADGDMDFFYAYEGTSDGEGGVYWLEYQGGDPGTASNWQKHEVAQINGGWWIAQRQVNISEDATGNDIVVSARDRRNSAAEPGVYWLEEPANVSEAWTIYTIEDASTYDPLHVTVGNFCGDGHRKDVAASAFDGGTGIYYYCFSDDYSRTVLRSDGRWHNTQSADLDGGAGRDEIVVADHNLNTEMMVYSWNGTAYTQRSATQYDKPDDRIIPYDLNGDGFKDVFAVSSSSNSVDWWETDTSSEWASRKTNQSAVVNNSVNSIEFDFSANGFQLPFTGEWNVKVAQSDGTTAFADSNRTITVESDNSAPSISNLTAAPDPVETGNTVNVTASITDPDDNLDSVLCTLKDADDNVVVDNVSMSTDGTDLYWCTHKPQTSGEWTAEIFVNDTNGSSSTESTTFTVESGPSISWKNLQDNATSDLKPDGQVLISVDWKGDQTPLNESILAINESGSFVNTSSQTPLWKYSGSYQSLSNHEGGSAGIYQDSSGQWYSADGRSTGDNIQIYYENFTHKQTIVVGTETPGPWGVHRGDNNNWYLIDPVYEEIDEYDGGWEYQTAHDYSSVCPDDTPTDIHQDNNGNWWLLCGGILYKYDSSWSYTGTSQNLSGTVERLRGMFQDSEGYWWVADDPDSGSTFIRKYDSSWSYTGASHEIEDHNPRDLVYSNAGNWRIRRSGSSQLYNYHTGAVADEFVSFNYLWKNNSFSGVLGYKLWGQNTDGEWNVTDTGSFVSTHNPAYTDQKIIWNGIGGSETKQVELTIDDSGESDIESHNSPPSGSEELFTNSTLRIGGWFSAFDWAATVTDKFGRTSPEYRINFTTTDQGLQEDDYSHDVGTQQLNQPVILENRGPNNAVYDLTYSSEGTVVKDGSASGTISSDSSITTTEVWQGDWINETAHGLTPQPSEVTLGVNYSGDRILELANTQSVAWTDVNTTGAFSPNHCNQINSTRVNLSASATTNYSIEFTCPPGDEGAPDLVKTLDADDNNDTHYNYTTRDLEIYSNATRDRNVTWKIDKSELTDWNDRKSQTGYINGNATGVTVEDGVGFVYVTFTTECCSSSPAAGNHSAALFYEVGSEDTTINEGSSGGGGGGSPSTDPQELVKFENTRFTLPFGTACTPEDGCSFTIQNLATEQNSVGIAMQEQEFPACRFFEVKRTLSDDAGFGKIGTYLLNSSTEVTFTQSFNRNVPVRVEMPNQTVFEQYVEDNELRCGFEVGTSRGAAEELVLVATPGTSPLAIAEQVLTGWLTKLGMEGDLILFKRISVCTEIDVVTEYAPDQSAIKANCPVDATADVPWPTRAGWQAIVGLLMIVGLFVLLPRVLKGDN
ncbi:FG-GAP-like repeat-containing protein [Halomontanus rarus]|uniref:FG-GAP-like repeat-containing protein n=1 Tax=Halomontanus rarus TaxID=3034020 RepID=UPI001A9984AD